MAQSVEITERKRGGVSGLGDQAKFEGIPKNLQMMEALLDDYLPSCIIVNEEQEIVHVGGQGSKYLTFATGKATFNIHKLMPSRLSVLIGAGIHKLSKKMDEVVYRNVRFSLKDEIHLVHITIKPFRAEANNRLVIVIIEEENGVRPGEGPEDERSDEYKENMQRRITELSHDLQIAQANMQDLVEELEVANQDLIAANEEMRCTNEELQSVNRELIAVNTEYNQKIKELTDLSNDLDNFLASTQIGTIFLDCRLCVKRYTKVITKEINLMPVDIGRPIAHISHNFQYNDLLKDAQEVLSSYTPLEKEVQSKSGSWYRMSILPYRTAQHTNSGVIMTFVDISEIKSAYQELEKLSYAIEQSPSIVVIADTKGKIEYVNPKFTEQTGYSPREVIGRNLSDLHTKSVSSRLFKEIWSTLATGNKWSGEMESERRGGETYWEGVSILPIKNPGGETIHLLKVSQDITERKTTEELLRKSEMLSAVGQLAAGIAHEIRNPLTALKGFTKLLDAGTSNKTYTQIMTAELERIESIISELLVLAKPQIWNFYKKDIVYTLQDVIMLLDTQAIMNNVEIVTSFDHDVPPVSCVENQLKQVFINVLKNGIEAMPDGGRLTVNVNNLDGQHVRICFTDEGCGISEDKIPKLGEPFYSTKEKGTGLGLMVSFKIIENHHGTIAVKSDLGKGTTVEIILPVET